MHHNAIGSFIKSLKALHGNFSVLERLAGKLFLSIKPFKVPWGNSKPYKVFGSSTFLSSNDSHETFVSIKPFNASGSIQCFLRSLKVLHGNFSVLERLPGNFCVDKAV
jgi:hypothetical protein